MKQTELRRVKEVLETPLLYKRDVDVILIDVYGLAGSRARKIYSAMRESYQQDFKKKNLVIFPTSTPRKYVFDFLDDLGITKNDILREAERVTDDGTAR